MCNYTVENEKPAFWKGPLTRLWKTAGLPALVYLGVALGLPLLNGAADKFGGHFWKHALFTFATLSTLILVLMGLELVWTRLWARLKGRGAAGSA